MLKRLLAFLGASIALIAGSEIFFAGKFSTIAVIFILVAASIWILISVRSNITDEALRNHGDNSTDNDNLLETREQSASTRSKSVASGFSLDDKGWLVHEESLSQDPSEHHLSRSKNRKSEEA